MGPLAALALAASLGACGSGPKPVEQARALPPDLVQSEVLNVQVDRVGTSIALTNTTPRDLPAGTLWLNGRFSRAFEGLPVGQSASIPLSEFQDKFGERFRAGGFFATLDRDPVVLAQIEVPPAQEGAPVRLIGLIALNDRQR